MKSKINTKIIDGWKYIRIGQLFKKSISGEWGSDPDGKDDVMVIGTPDFNNDGTINWKSLRNRNIKTSRLSIRLINKGNILIEKSGGSDDQPAGRVVYCDKSLNGTCSNFVQLLIVSDAFDSKFIFYVLYFYYKKGLIYQYQQKTTGIINFKINEYFKEQVLLPELKTEQIKIERILSTIDKLIQETEKIIKKYKKIKQGLMQDLFRYGIDKNGRIRNEKTHRFKDTSLGRIPIEWNIKSINELSEYIGSGITPTGGQSVYLNEGIKFMRSQNVHFQKLLLNDIAYIDIKTHNKMKRSEIFPNDVLLNITGASIGRCCVVPENFGLANVNQHVCAIRLRTNKNLISEFLSYFISTQKGQNQINILNAGSNRQGLNYEQLRAIKVIWPSQEEIERIVLIFIKANDTVTEEEIYKKKLVSLKQGLMNDLLSGKVSIKHLIN